MYKHSIFDLFKRRLNNINSAVIDFYRNLCYYIIKRCATLNNDVTGVIMADLKIGEVIFRERRKLKMTQEELARSLDVSAQAVSNWERGGYPDITLLPRIANYFKITVDELIGNDEASRQTEIEGFMEKYNKSAPAEQLSLSKEYYKKYPMDYTVCESLALAILRNKHCWKDDYPLLKEACEKILSECTWEYARQNARECMSIVCPDEEWENWKYKSEQFYSSCQNERIEERFWQREKQEEYKNHNTANNLLSLMHFLGREYMRYFEKDNYMIFEDPQRTAALMKYRMKIIECISNDGGVPEAWSGCYADLCLKAAGALIGAGELDEGYAYLESAFELFEVWQRIPNGAKMEVGNPALFGNAKISKIEKNCEVNIFLENGTKVWIPYLWLFWQNSNDILHAMTNWPWFDGVREDRRYIELLERAKELAGTK